MYERVKKWHMETFPNAEAATQEKRVYDELEEYDNEKDYNRRLEELADAYISYVGLTRFCEDVVLFAKIYDEVHKHFSRSGFVEAVLVKLNVNKERANNGYWVYDEASKEYIAAHKLK